MSDEELVREDRIGQEIRIGSIVAAPDSKTSIKICRVVKIAPKQIRCADINATHSGYGTSWYKYPGEVICLDEMEATVMYLMTRNL